TQINGSLTFEVTDDGDGFDPTTTGYGTGLQGMADRLDAIGGTLMVRSEPGHGNERDWTRSCRVAPGANRMSRAPDSRAPGRWRAEGDGGFRPTATWLHELRLARKTSSEALT